MIHTIELTPWSSPPLHLNQRLHWAKESRIKRDVMDLVNIRARHPSAMFTKRPYDAVTVWLRWEPKVVRRRDGDNPMATMKACVDGLVKAGVISDDTTEHVTHAPLELLPANRTLAKGRLWLCVEAE